MCGSYRHRVASREPVQTIISEPSELRASDAERERVVEALRTHAAAGRLDVDEFEARIDRAYAAATRAELRPLLADLPATFVPVAPLRRRAAHEWQAWAVVAVLLLVVWAATGAGVFWPVWPIGFWALSLMLGRGAPLHRWERPRV